MKAKKFLTAIAVIVVLILINIIYTAAMISRCSSQLPPDNLTPEEVIYQLVEYWNTGNQKGISMICAEDYQIQTSDEAYSFYEDVIRKNVVITECTDVTEVISDDIYPQFYDKHYFRVSWDGDNIEWDWRSGGFAFFLIAREDENSQYKICSMASMF